MVAETVTMLITWIAADAPKVTRVVLQGELDHSRFHPPPR